MPNDFVSVISPRGTEKSAESSSGAGGRLPLPVLPVRDTVLFPHAVLPLTVGRESSIQLIQSLGEELRNLHGPRARFPRDGDDRAFTAGLLPGKLGMSREIASAFIK